MLAVRILVLSCLYLTCGLAFSQTKVVLIEEGTGTWCQWCPRGMVKGHELLNDHPGQVLLVAAHQGDPMEIPGLAYFNALNFTGLPNGSFDRSSGAVDPNSWSAILPAFLNLTPPADVVVNRIYDSTTRELSITIETNFFSTLSNGDYRIGAIVIEDGVIGSTPDYAQSNAYIGGQNGIMGGYESLSDPVPAGIMVFDHVARALLSDFDGLAASLPSSPQAGQSYSATFMYVIPADQNPEYIRIYGYLSDATSSTILNAGSGEYASGDLNARPFFHSDSLTLGSLNSLINFNIRCHDPDDDTLTITAVSGLPSWASISPHGINDALLTGTPNAAGIYVVELEVSDGPKTRTQYLTIDVSASNASWIPIGQAGFSIGPSQYITRSAFDPVSENVYSLLVTSGDLIEVHKWDGITWSLVGNPQAASWSRTGDIEVHPITGEAWLVYHTGAFYTQIMRFTGNQWTPVGNLLQGKMDTDLEFSSTGIPYVCITRSGLGTTVYSWDSNNWNAIGGGMLSLAGSPLITSGRLEIDHNEQPMVLVNTFFSSIGYSTVLSFDGSTWSELNNGVINPNAPTITSSLSEHELETGANGEVYTILAHDQGSNVYSYNGTSWDTLVVNIDGGIHEVFDASIGQNSELYVLYQNGQGGLTCEAWDGTTWGTVGLPNFTPLTGNADLFVYSNGEPGVVYADASLGGKLSAQRYTDTNIGLEETYDEIEVSFVYPNPCHTTLNFNNSRLNSEYYQITDQVGKVVARGSIRNGTINVTVLSDGMYSVSFPNKNKVIRFIKQ